MKAKTQKILAAGAALALLGIMAASLLLRRDGWWSGRIFS